MHKADFWTSCADAMEMSIEGNRLIANELVGLAGGVWQRLVRTWDGLTHRSGHQRHLPPV